MKAKGWRLTFSLIIVVLAAALVLRWMEPPEDGAEQGEAVQAVPASADLRAYFPSLPGMTYFFAGEGRDMPLLPARSPLRIQVLSRLKILAAPTWHRSSNAAGTRCG
jgi:hypothetical protein